MQQPTLTVALVALGAVLIATLIVVISRRRARTPEARLRAGSRDLLGDVLIPDGEDGEKLDGLDGKTLPVRVWQRHHAGMGGTDRQVTARLS